MSTQPSRDDRRSREQRPSQNGADESAPLSGKVAEMSTLLAGLGGTNRKFLTDLIAFAERRKPPSRGEIAAALRGSGIRESAQTINRISKAVQNFSAAHKRAPHKIREAVPVADAPDVSLETDFTETCLLLETVGTLNNPLLVWAKAKKEIGAREDFNLPRKPYLGLPPVSGERPSAAPPLLTKEFQTVESAGQNPTAIFDNLLIARSLAAPVPAACVERHYPAKSGDKVKYRAALDRMNDQLGSPEATGLLEQWGESADRLAARFSGGRKYWASDRHPHLGKQHGPVLLVDPSLGTLPHVLTLPVQCPFTIVSNNFWEAGIYVALTHGHKQRATVIQERLRESLLPKLGTGYQTIFVAGSGLLQDHSKLRAIEAAAKLLRRGGQIIFETEPYPRTRFSLLFDARQLLFNPLVDSGEFSVQFEFGRTACGEIEGDLKRVFYPASPAERDRIILTRVDGAKAQSAKDDFLYGTKVLENLAIFQDPAAWNWMINMASIVGARHENGLFDAFRHLGIGFLSMFGGRREEDRGLVEPLAEGMPGSAASEADIQRFIAKGHFEELARYLIDNPLVVMDVDESGKVPPKGIGDMIVLSHRLDGHMTELKRESRKKRR